MGVTQEVANRYKSDLVSEQIEEAKESKATAISLAELTFLAFSFLLLNVECAMLGMNLQHVDKDVSVWTFLVLLLFFSFLTYLFVYLRPRYGFAYK